MSLAALNEKAWKLLQEGQNEEALALVNEAPWGEGRDRQRKYEVLSRALLQLDLLEQARVMITEGLKEYPENPILLTLMGNYHVIWKEYPHAREIYDKAGMLFPENRVILWNMAFVRQLQGDYDGARDHYRSLLKLDPGDEQVAAKVAWCTLLGGHPEEARKIFSARVRKQDPDLADFQGLFWSYYDQGFLEQATVTLVNAIQKCGVKDSNLYLNLTAIYVERGRLEDAKRTLQTALKTCPDAERFKVLHEAIAEEQKHPDPERNIQIAAVLTLAGRRDEAKHGQLK